MKEGACDEWKGALERESEEDRVKKRRVEGEGCSSCSLVRCVRDWRTK